MATPNADASKGPLMLALTRQAQDDAYAIGVLQARLIRRGYRARAERAIDEGRLQGGSDKGRLF